MQFVFENFVLLMLNTKYQQQKNGALKDDMINGQGHIYMIKNMFCIKKFGNILRHEIYDINERKENRNKRRPPSLNKLNS